LYHYSPYLKAPCTLNHAATRPADSSLLYCAAPHPVLHSFPTRRSSDLVAGVDAVERRAPPDASGYRRQSASPPGAGPDALGSTRSEEHTSELQSRVDLVCRLLLEKKKQHVKQDGPEPHNTLGTHHSDGV